MERATPIILHVRDGPKCPACIFPDQGVPKDQMEQTIGQRLRHARESIPVSVYQAARETKIRVDFLEHMEADNFRFLSGHLYVRGMVRSYSRWLGIDDEPLLLEFDRLYAPKKEATIPGIIREPAEAPKTRRPKWLIAATVAASTLLVLSLVGVMKPVRNVAPPPKTDIAASGTPNAPSVADDAVAQAPSPSGLQLSVTVIGEKSWLRVLADGGEQAVFESTMFEGDTRVFEASSLLRVTIGNLGAVRIQLNGRDLGSPGAAGQFGTFVFTPASTGFSRG